MQCCNIWSKSRGGITFLCYRKLREMLSREFISKPNMVPMNSFYVRNWFSSSLGSNEIDNYCVLVRASCPSLFLPSFSKFLFSYFRDVLALQWVYPTRNRYFYKRNSVYCLPTRPPRMRGSDNSHVTPNYSTRPMLRPIIINE